MAHREWIWIFCNVRSGACKNVILYLKRSKNGFYGFRRFLKIWLKSARSKHFDKQMEIPFVLAKLLFYACFVCVHDCSNPCMKTERKVFVARRINKVAACRNVRRAEKFWSSESILQQKTLLNGYIINKWSLACNKNKSMLILYF